MGDVLPGRIVSRTAREHGLTAADLCIGGRSPAVVAARRDAIHRLRRHTGLSLNEIARQVGLTDHTTVRHHLAQPQPDPPGLEWAPAPTVCVFDGCDRDVWARGWCHAHYEQWQRTGTVWPVRGYDVSEPDPAVCEGTPWSYKRGCGCPRCRKAWAIYQNRWRQGVRATVDAAATRGRIGELRQSMTLKAISDQSGVAVPSLSMIARGLVARVRRDTACAVAAVRPACETCGGEAMGGGRWCAVGGCAARRGRWSWSQPGRAA